MARENNKRQRLVEAADTLFHERGFNMTTLANIAELADVPLGNVYYYFKSKDSIAIAVIERRAKMFQELSSNWDHSLQTSVDKLKAFIDYSISETDRRTQFGDSLGSLCQELGKQEGNLSDAVASLMAKIMTWVEKQFEALNKPEAASKLAANLIATLQGMSLLTVTFKDSEYLSRQSQMLVDWIENI